jgi:sugar phosphate isomerase/epimerase
MKIKLGINTGFALNRFSNPEDWIPLVANEFKIKYVQFTADLLNPSLSDEIIQDHIKRINKLTQKYNIAIEHSFTGGFTRVNHLSHPDKNIRNYWINWFCKFADISVSLGAKSMGSHFGILTTPDLNNPIIRNERLKQNIEGWHKIATYAKAKGLEYLTWEPMSIAREYGENIAETKKLQKLLNTDTPLPFKLCLDVDHGDVTSANPDDTNPYKWIKELGNESPIIHIKQSSQNKGGHWPFTAEHNKDGRIKPKKLINTLKETNLKEVTLLLELSFREREPFDSRVIKDCKESALFWKPYISN